MSRVTVDRFGRIVLPRTVRQRHGWRPGTALELRDGPEGLAVVAAPTEEALPEGLEWQNGLLVSTATAPDEFPDLTALRDALDADRDRNLSGMP